MKVLGLSCFYHDSAAALIIDGRVHSACEEERLSRKKGDSGFPQNAIGYCLGSANLRLSDLDAVVFYEKPWVKFERILHTYFAFAPRGAFHFVKKLPSILPKTLFLRQTLESQLSSLDPDWNPETLAFSDHHLSHAAASFYCSPFAECDGLIVDAVGEWATTSTFNADALGLSVLQEIHFPHSLGMFYSAVTAFCGFKVNSGEYKLMGLAPYGNPRYKSRILDQIVSPVSHGGFKCHRQAFDFFSEAGLYTDLWEEIFEIKPRYKSHRELDCYADVAASAQAALEDLLVHILIHQQKQTHRQDLCMGGGVALNCVANSVILQRTEYRNLWIQPAAGDAGGAIGAALAYHYGPEGGRGSDRHQMQNAFLGPEFSDQEIEAELKKLSIRYEHKTKEKLCVCVVDDLLKGRVVANFDGRMEFGPRALGGRSILADPRLPDMKENLNRRTKLREAFRPFAPVVMEEKVEDWFEWSGPSPFMLFTAQVRKGRVPLPAVTHVDGSARIQTVNREQNLRLHGILEEFERRTGCPILVNTSFNVRGEPIVCSPRDALRSFFECGIDTLYIGSFRIDKESNPSVPQEIALSAFAED